MIRQHGQCARPGRFRHRGIGRRLLVLVMLFPGFASAGSDLDRLHAGVVRYALDTGDLPRAVLMARTLTGDDAAFLRARVAYASGRQALAIQSFASLARGPQAQPRAALQLARARVAQGHPDAALPWFRQVAARGFGSARQEALYAIATQQRLAGDSEAAGRTLAAMEPGYWSALGYQNLATDYANNDHSSARALVALRVALAMVGAETDPSRARDLRDRLLLQAGYLSYRSNDFDKAVGFLSKVSLEGPVTPEALYFHGLALSAQGNQRAALQSWHRAKKFPLAYPGASDAWLGTGRGYDLAGYLGQAGEAYLAANAAFESEQVTLRKLTDTVRAQGAYEALVANAGASEGAWFLSGSGTLRQPRQAYLMAFLEDAGAQAAVARLATLVGLEARVSRERQDLGVLAAELRRAGRSGAPALDRVTQALTRHSALLEDMTSALGALQKASGAELDRLALAFLGEQDRRMKVASDKTEQQIAHLYDYLALQALPEQAP